MSKKGHTLMGHEISRARLRVLTPIGEDTSLSPVPDRPAPQHKSSDNPRLAEPRTLTESNSNGGQSREELKYPRDHQLVLISDRIDGFEPYSPDIVPPIPSPEPVYNHRNKELNSLIDGYLARHTVQLRAHRRHDVAFCECCEPVNTVNREKRKLYWGKVAQQSEHESDPLKAGLDLTDYGLVERTEDVADEKPVHEGRYQLLYPTLAARAAPLKDAERGSAALLYPYLPRPINLDGYYNEWGEVRNMTNPPYERHLTEDLMQAASNYDASMMRLRGTVDLFSDHKHSGAFS